MNGFMNDLRHALRGLAKSPGFTSAATFPRAARRVSIRS
jgi:hypothetical protein